MEGYPFPAHQPVSQVDARQDLYYQQTRSQINLLPIIDHHQVLEDDILKSNSSSSSINFTQIKSSMSLGSDLDEEAHHQNNYVRVIDCVKATVEPSSRVL